MKGFIKVLVGLLIAAQAALADDGANLVGTWKLLSMEIQFQDGRPSRAQYGSSPLGYVIYTSQGRFMTVIEGEGRKAPKTDEDRAELLRTMFAYTGMYRVEGDKLMSKIDVSWNPVFHGLERVSTFTLDNDRLQSITSWLPAPNIPGAPITRAVVTWERVK